LSAGVLRIRRERRPNDRYKVLDFGLAKAMSADVDAGFTGDVSQSPTLAHTGTQAGFILGTAAYMSPEQARGKPVDKRADIWAFGVVLFEMLTGGRLFAGETVSDVLAAVLTRNPEWASLPPSTPPGGRVLLRRCLERDPRKRLHDIADARIVLEDSTVEGDTGSGRVPAASETHGSSRVPPGPRLAAIIVVSAGLGLVLGGFLWRGSKGPVTQSRPSTAVRFEIPFPKGSTFLGDLALSPDGGSLIFSARDSAGVRSLWLRSLDALEARPIAGTEDARFPFWSPDGRRLGFFAGAELRVMDLLSRASRTLARATGAFDARGVSWGADDVIVFAPSYVGGLMRVGASGGEVQPATRLDVAGGEGTHRVPNFMPDGRHFLFYSSPGTGTEPGKVCVAQIGSLEHRCLAEANSTGLVAAAHSMLYVRGKTLLAQRLDPARQELTGEPVALGPELASNLGTSGYRALGNAGDTLAYQVGTASVNRLAWIERDGKERESVFDRDGVWVLTPRLDPNGTRVSFAAYRENGLGEIWIVDPARKNEMRMTWDDDSSYATWSRTGRELASVVSTKEGATLRRMPSDKPGGTRLWKSIPGLATVDSWLAGDKGVLFTAVGADTRSDIWRLDDLPGAEPRPLLRTVASEHSPEASPDGSWLAYVSDATGREEVFVQDLDGSGSPYKVSSDGGNDPHWRADGRELFYVSAGGRFHAVPTSLGETFTAGSPQFLFSVPIDEFSNRQYDVTPDGRRFVVTLRKTTVDSPIVVVTGIAEEIERLLARGGGAR